MTSIIGHSAGGPQVGFQRLVGGWPQGGPSFNEQILPDGTLTWAPIANAYGYTVFAFRQGAQFPVNMPNNREVWVGFYVNTLPADSPNHYPGFIGMPWQDIPGTHPAHFTEVLPHLPPEHLTIEAFHITNNTLLMRELAAVYVELPANVTQLDLTTMAGLQAGYTYQFRIQAMAPEITGAPVLNWAPVGDLPWSNSLLSGVQFMGPLHSPGHPNRTGVPVGVDFPEFTVGTIVAPDTWTVTFDPAGGTLDSGLLVQTINDGTNATPPTVSRANHTFYRWDPIGAYNNVTGNRTITAMWTPIAATISPVTNVQFEVSAGGQQVLSWNAPADTSSITGYRIEFTTAADWETAGAISSVMVAGAQNTALCVMSAIAQVSGSIITPGVYNFRVVSVGAGGTESEPVVLTNTLTVVESGVPVTIDSVTWGLANRVISVFGPFNVGQSLVVSYWVMGTEASRTTIFGQTVPLNLDEARFVFYEPPGFRDEIFDFSNGGQVFVWEQTQFETAPSGDVTVTITPPQMHMLDL